MGETRDDIPLCGVLGEVCDQLFPSIVCIFLKNDWYYDHKISLFIRFKGQKQLHKSKPSDFQMAIEEALLAEDGYVDATVGSMLMSLREADVSGLPDASTSNQDLEYYSEKVRFLRTGFLFLVCWRCLSELCYELMSLLFEV